MKKPASADTSNRFLNALAAVSCALLLALFSNASGGPHHASSVNHAQALQKLLDGNSRFAQGNLKYPNQSNTRRTELSHGQHPFAVILGCSDSRVPPELIFDQGLGDLFVVRLAGNVADPVATESIVYAVKHLGARLIMVLGHQRCGAVTAAVEGHGGPGDVGPLMTELRPAVLASRSLPGDPIANAIRANVELTVEKLKKSEALSAMVKSGELRIVGAIYHLDSGKVETLSQPVAKAPSM